MMTDERPALRLRDWLVLGWRRGFSSARTLVLGTMSASMVVMVLLVPIVSATQGNARALQSGSGVLNDLEVTADDESGGPLLTRQTRAQIAEIPDVLSVVPELNSSVYSGSPDSNWIAQIYVIRPTLLPPGISADMAESLQDDQVIAPSDLDGDDLRPLVGKKLPIEYTKGIGDQVGTGADGTLKLVAVYDPEWSAYPPNTILGTESLVVDLVAARYRQSRAEILDKQGVPLLYVTVNADADAKKIEGQIRSLGLNVVSERDQMGELPGLVSSFPQVLVLAGVGTLLLLIALIRGAVQHAIATRLPELALLRMRGWSGRKVRLLIGADCGIGVAIGALAGVVIGGALGMAVARQLLPPDLGGMVNVLPIVGVALLLWISLIAVTLVVAAIMTRSMLRIDPYLLLAQD